MPSATLKIPPNSSLHRRIISALTARHQLSKTKIKDSHDRWRLAEEKFLAYLPEREVDAKRRVLREQSGQPQYTTIVLPYSYAMLMTAHTYWTTVFLSRTPILQFSGRHGESAQQVQALEALIDYQVQVGEMVSRLYIWLLDAGKYGVGIVGNYWDEEEVIISEIREEEQMIAGIIPTGRMKRRRVVQRVPGYEGNKLFNVRPYNFFPDPRVPLGRFQEGEFCGYYTPGVGWNTIIRRERQGYFMNIDRLRKGGSQWNADTSVDQGSGQLDVPDPSNSQLYDTILSEADLKKQANFVGLYSWYVELIPSEWGLGKTNFPEKWVFTTDAQISLLIGASPLGAIHNKFPFQVIEYEPEGYAFSNRSMMEVLDPVQRTMDWLVNAHFYNVRKALNHQLIVDPSRVVMKDLLDPLPGNIVRAKPIAYGSNPKDAIHQLAFVDVTRGHMADLQSMNEFGQKIVGINDQLMGALSQKGRRTATEVRTSSTFGINRLKTSSEYFSATGWQQLSQMMVQNSQQYYSDDKKFHIVGDLVLEAGKNFIDVNPEAIQGFYDFVPVDGTLPVDRFAQANMWQNLLVQLPKIPQVAAQYDLGRIFAWVAQLAGLKNINQFKIEVQPDALLQQQAQQGNVVAMPTNPEASPEPGQVPNVGPTG